MIVSARKRHRDEPPEKPLEKPPGR
jgi:hypothetical protein